MPGDPTMSYSDVLGFYKKVKHMPEFQGLKLPEFSRQMNELYESDQFSAGLEDSVLKRASVGIDQALQATRIPQATESLGRSLGELISPELGETGAHLGKELPRGVVDFGLTGAGVMATLGGAPMVGVPLAGLGASSAFAKGYTDTGLKAVGAINAASGLLAPGAGSLGARYVTGGLSKKLGATAVATDVFGTVVNLPGSQGRQVAGRFVDMIGRNIGDTALNELSRQSASLVQGQGLQNPFTTENIFVNAAQLVPFLPQNIYAAAKGPAKGHLSVGSMLRHQEAERTTQNLTEQFRTATPEQAREILSGLNAESLARENANDPNLIGTILSGLNREQLNRDIQAQLPLTGDAKINEALGRFDTGNKSILDAAGFALQQRDAKLREVEQARLNFQKTGEQEAGRERAPNDLGAEQGVVVTDTPKVVKHEAEQFLLEFDREKTLMGEPLTPSVKPTTPPIESVRISGEHVFYHGTREGVLSELRTAPPTDGHIPGPRFDRGIVSLAFGPGDAARYGELHKVTLETTGLKLFNPLDEDHVNFLKSAIKDPEQVIEFFEVYGDVPLNLQEYWKGFPNDYLHLESARRLIRQAGFDGYLTQETQHGELHLFDPSKIKKVEHMVNSSLLSAHELSLITPEKVAKVLLDSDKTLPQIVQVSKMINLLRKQVGQKTGQPSISINDAVLAEKLEALLAQGDSETVAYDKVMNWLHDQLGKASVEQTRAAAKPSLKERNEAKAIARISAAAQPVQDAIGEVITKLSKEASDQAFDTRPLLLKAAKVLEGYKPEFLNDETRLTLFKNKLEAALRKRTKTEQTGFASKRAGVENAEGQREGGTVSLDQLQEESNAFQVEDPQAPAIGVMSEAGRKALVEQETEIVHQQSEAHELIPVSLDEASTALGHPATDKELAFLNEAATQIDLGEITASRNEKGKLVYTFTDEGLERLAAILGVTPKVARNYFKTKGLEPVIKVMKARQAQKIAMTDPSEADFMAMGLPPIDSFQPGDLMAGHQWAGKPAPANAFPLGAKNWFERYGKQMGMADAEAVSFGEAAGAVASIYKDLNHIRIAELITSDDSVLGVNIRKVGGQYQYDQAIALNRYRSFFRLAESINEEGQPGLLRFAKLHVFGHEMGHSMFNLYRKQLENPGQRIMSEPRFKRMHEIYKWADGLNAEDRALMLRTMYQAIVPGKLRGKTVINEELETFIELGAKDTSEFLSSYSSLINLGLARPSKQRAGSYKELGEEIMFSPKYLADFANMYYADATQLSSAFADMWKVNKSLDKDLLPGLIFANNAFRELAQTQAEINKSVNRMRFLQNSDPQNYLHLVKEAQANPVYLTSKQSSDEVFLSDYMREQFPDKELRGVALQFMRDTGLSHVPKGSKEVDRLLGADPNWFERWLMPVPVFKELYPWVNDLVDTVYNFRSIATQHSNEALKPFMVEDKNFKLVFDENHKGITRIATEPKLQRVFNQIRLESNLRGFKTLTHEEIHEFAKAEGLSQADGDFLVQHSAQSDLAMQHMANVQVAYATKSLAVPLMGVLMRDLRDMAPLKMQPKEVIKLANDFTSAYLTSLNQDPVMSANGQRAMVELSMGLPTEVVEKMQRILQESVIGDGKQETPYQRFVATFDPANSPSFSPEVRLGEYQIRAVRGGKSFFTSTKTRMEAEAVLEKLKGDQTVEADSIKLFSKTDRLNESRSINTEAARVWADLESDSFERVKREVGDQDSGLSKFFIPGNAVLSEVTGRSYKRHTMQQKHVEGREDLNMQEGILNYINAVSLGVAKNYTRQIAMVHMMSDDMRANPKMKRLMSDYISTVIDPPAQEWTTFKRVIFQMTMGANLSNLVMESAQPIFSLAPWFTRNGTGFAKSYQFTFDAMKDVYQYAVTPDAVLPKKYMLMENGKEVSILEKAQREGKMGYGWSQELAQSADVAASNARRLAAGDMGIDSPKTLVLKPIVAYANWTQNLYTRASSTNERIALLAGYNFAIEKGMGQQEAYNFALRTKDTTMFGGGAAARPIDLFANKGNMFGAVGAWYTLKHYTAAMVGTMYKLSKESLNKDMGLTPAEVAQARKSLAQMVGTQLVMSGALGLPMGAGTLALVEQLFPDMEVKKSLRENLAKVFNEDNEQGAPITDAMLNGLPSMLGSMDLTQRFGLGDIFGVVDPQRGFQLENAFGVGGVVAKNLGTAVTEVASGNYGKATQLAAPNAFKGIINLYNNDGMVRDAQGKLLFEPTVAETLMTSIGFRPKRLAEAREQSRMLSRSNEIEARQTREFHNQLAEQLLKGDAPGVRAALLQKAQENEFYDPKAGLRSVVELAQARSVPADPNSRGPLTTLTQREELTRSYAALNRPSEVQLLTQRKGLERQIGLPGGVPFSRTELLVAQVTDQLMAQYPTLQRQHARVLAQRQLARTPAGRGTLYRSVGNEQPALTP